MKVGFIGLGKLGQPCAEAMADVYEVEGFDLELRQPRNFNTVSTIAEAVAGKDLVFIAAPTGHDPKYGGSTPISGLEPKDFDYEIVKGILDEVNAVATEKQLIVLISTVLPGTTREHFAHRITNARFIYNPYLIAMGSVAWDMVNPEMVIIGTEDGEETGDAKLLIDFYRPLMQNDPRYVVGTWDEAEAIKVFYNTFISMKIGLVNMIQDVAERNGNMNVDVVTDALKDSTFRITGPKYMKAGMGDAGPCHPRDNIALRYLAQRLDLRYDLFEAIMEARDVQARNLAGLLAQLAEANNLPIFIHGEAYKPGVPYLEGSYSSLVASYLHRYSVTFIDPLTRPDEVPDRVKGVILMAHNAKVTYDYTGIPQINAQYCKFEEGSVIVDPWREYPQTAGLRVIHYGNTRRHQ